MKKLFCLYVFLLAIILPYIATILTQRETEKTNHIIELNKQYWMYSDSSWQYINYPEKAMYWRSKCDSINTIIRWY